MFIQATQGTMHQTYLLRFQRTCEPFWMMRIAGCTSLPSGERSRLKAPEALMMSPAKVLLEVSGSTYHIFGPILC